MAYFSKFFKEEQRDIREEVKKWLIETMTLVISVEENEVLVQMVTEEEEESL